MNDTHHLNTYKDDNGCNMWDRSAYPLRSPDIIHIVSKFFFLVVRLLNGDGSVSSTYEIE